MAVVDVPAFPFSAAGILLAYSDAEAPFTMATLSLAYPAVAAATPLSLQPFGLITGTIIDRLRNGGPW